MQSKAQAVCNHLIVHLLSIFCTDISSKLNIFLCLLQPRVPWSTFTIENVAVEVQNPGRIAEV